MYMEFQLYTPLRELPTDEAAFKEIGTDPFLPSNFLIARRSLASSSQTGQHKTRVAFKTEQAIKPEWDSG